MLTSTLSVKEARDQLTLILSFFSRVDAKLSTILAINTAMLAALSSSLPAFSSLTSTSAIPTIATALLIAFSYVCLYRGGFPNLKGGHSSLIYFMDIARRNESNFIDSFEALTDEQLRRDLLAQVWRNSEILSEKYKYLRRAFIGTALSVLPWSISLAIFAAKRVSLNVIGGCR